MPCLPGFSPMKAATHSPACVSQPALFGQRLCGIALVWSFAHALACAQPAVADARRRRLGEQVGLVSLHW